MDQPAHMSKKQSPAGQTPESALTPARLPPMMQTEPPTEKHSEPLTSRSEISSPIEPFPELDLEVGAEPNPSPTFAHEADICISPTALSLPAPALHRIREIDTGPVVIARVQWKEGEEDEEERGDMREATSRALEWAKKMFGKDAERRVEDGEESRHGNAE
jgi:hypothetical protein